MAVEAYFHKFGQVVLLLNATEFAPLEALLQERLQGIKSQRATYCAECGFELPECEVAGPLRDVI